MFEDFILLVCSHLFMFWLGYKWGVHSAVVRLIKNFIDDPKDLQDAFNKLRDIRDNDEIADAKSDDEIEIEAHVQGTQVYLWRKDTNQFLAQGKSIDEAIMAISQHHEGHYRIDKATVDKIKLELPSH
jgi:hypothetical protein